MFDETQALQAQQQKLEKRNLFVLTLEDLFMLINECWFSIRGTFDEVQILNEHGVVWGIIDMPFEQFVQKTIQSKGEMLLVSPNEMEVNKFSILTK